MPILDRLARLREEKQGQLIGVRALFFYPLNALINSQRERLRAWTHAFEGDVRFCLYNGNTPERPDPAWVQRENPCEIGDRKRLRASPPPILVTNATMLEYMLVRTADAPILAQSQGKLEWVVLDEAHTYVGSQAAEAALLIRRVLFAFGVSPDQVRFVATNTPAKTVLPLSGPDSGLAHTPYDDWGADVHIPYAGVCMADLFIRPYMGFSSPERDKEGGALVGVFGTPMSHFMPGNGCRYVLTPDDLGELKCATRREVGEGWVLYQARNPSETKSSSRSIL